MERKIYFGCLISILFYIPCLGQAPQTFKYQSVARSSDGELLTNATIGLRMNIRNLSETGTVLYQETHSISTNALGLFSISVGNGKVVNGNFATIDWSTGAKFIEVEVDFAGGTSYTSMGASQLLSVPYALYAGNGKSGTNGLNILNGTTDPSSTTGVDGEFYINTTTQNIFGPKNSGAWPAGVSLVGPSGPSTNAWGLNGNSGTVDGTNFIGTTDNVPLNFKINNQTAGKIDNANAFIGALSGQSNLGGGGNAALGSFTLLNNTSGSFNTASGHEALEGNTTGNYNVAYGHSALQSNTTADGNTAIGTQALLTNSTGSGNTATGRDALYFNTTGKNNTGIGYQAGTTDNSLNANTSGNNNTFIGYNSGPGTSTQLTNATAIGYNALVSTNNSLVLGGTGADAVKVGIGVSSPAATLDVLGNIKIKDGTQGVGKVLTSDANGVATWTSPGSSSGWGLTGNTGTVDGTNFIGTTDNVPLNLKVNNKRAGRVSSSSEVFFGYQAGEANSGADNVGIGYQSLLVNSTGYRNTSTGSQSLTSNTTGNSNSSFGYISLNSNTSGYSNTAIGEASLYQNSTGFLNTAVGQSSLSMNTTGAYNSALGYFALGLNSNGQYNSALGSSSLGSNTSGNNNTAIGEYSLYSSTTGNNNTAFGFQAGYTANSANANTSGSNNTFIGYNSGPGTSTQLTNATAIGYNALVSTNNSLALGGTGADAVKVGIGVSSPTATLDVLGNIKIKDGTQGAGKVLTSDANGVATWTSPGSSSGWGLTGNAGTVDGTNFIGTTDNVPLNFKMFNQTAGRIDNANVFMGVLAGENNNTGLVNVGIGVASLSANTSGYGNVAVGAGTLQYNTVGYYNIAVGHDCLYSNTTGIMNTAIGSLSLMYNDIGYGNTSLGNSALRFNTSGSYNNAIGTQALEENTAGTNNDAHGYNSLQFNTTGVGNAAFGSQSLSSNTTGSYNTALGFNTFSTGATYSNSTAIGYNAQVTASNMIRLGDANVTSINGAVGFTVVSDKRFKKDITENVAGLSFIMKLRPVTYHMNMNEMAKFLKTPEDFRVKELEEQKEKILQTGFIAQEVEKAAQDLGYDFSGVDKPDGKDDFYGLRYAEFTVPLVKAVQEQQRMIDTLEKEVLLLKEQLSKSQLQQEKLESENNILKVTIEGRLKKLEEIVSVAAKK